MNSKQVGHIGSDNWAKKMSLGSFLPIQLSLAGWSDDREAIANVA